MSAKPIRVLAAALATLALLMWTRMPLSGQSGARNNEWRYYGGDAGSTKYSPLDQINKDNVKDLRIAWRWKTENFGARPDYNYEVTPLMVVRDVVVVGAALQALAPSKDFVAGFVRGYDVRTGKRVWIFHTIPTPGEFGNDTWEKDSWAYTGNTGVWGPMAADEELGYVYLPVETPTNDLYGGHRPGNGLFGESLVCLDARTGKRVWHFQFIHHGIWDSDIPTAPNLVDITVNGRRIKAVAQVTKQAFTYVFDRVNGQPVWPIEERPVPQSDVPGEKTSPTQPFPTKPAAFDRQGTSHDDLIDFTPALKAEAIKIADQYKMGPLYTPPIVRDANGKLALLLLPAHVGGANWPGGAADSETGVRYVASV